MSEPIQSSFYKTHFSPQQLNAARQAIEEYKQGKCLWIILLAQMQSGKTDTFLLIACELLRYRLVDYIVIFSGNAETELCDQLTKTIDGSSSNRYWRKYENYLGDEDLAEEYRLKLKPGDGVLNIVWGTQKSTYSGPTQKTLFIWEEAHFAQNKEQGPDKFLRNIGISADGSQHFLQEKENFVLTVSATPFSELSDQIHLEQSKKVVKMEPGDGYIGVGYLLREKRIRKWDTIQGGLDTACALPRIGAKWSIIRVIDKNSALVESVMKAKGWKCEKYDSSISLADRKGGKCKDTGFLAWQNMAAGRAPDVDTVIIIKGMCRMGKNINKSHLLFVFETSKSPASDTILQGLLGRVCGYGHHNVVVYLSAKVINGGDLERYAFGLWENPGVATLPRKGNNLSEKQVKGTKPIVPIAIKRDRSISTSNNEKDIKRDVYDALLNHPERVYNKNPQNHFEEVVAKFMDLHDNKKSGIHAFYMDVDKKTRGPEKAKALRSAFSDNIPREFGSGCGHAADGMQVNIWVNKNIEEFDTEVFYVTSVVEIDEDERLNFLIPKTTRREVFAHHLEDGTEIVCNGGMPKLLSSSTATDWCAMSDELSDFVEVSRDTAYYKGVISLGTDENGEPKGIVVTSQVLKELEKGGKIFKLIERMGATLKVEKSRGPIPKAIKGKDFIKLASITWEFKK